MKNMTYVDALNVVLAGENITDEVFERLSALRESLIKRNAQRSSKPTKAQLERETQYESLVEWLGENPESTCAEVAEFMAVTLHSATGLLTTLRKRGMVRRDYKGKTPVYSLGAEEDSSEE